MKNRVVEKIAKITHESLRESSSPVQEAHVLQSLVKVLSEKKALSNSERILYALKNLFDTEKGILKAEITTQYRLSDKEKSTLRKTLKEKYNAEDVYITEKIDERILGGIKIKIGENIYDATIKNKLTKLAHKLEQTS